MDGVSPSDSMKEEVALTSCQKVKLDNLNLSANDAIGGQSLVGGIPAVLLLSGTFAMGKLHDSFKP